MEEKPFLYGHEVFNASVPLLMKEEWFLSPQFWHSFACFLAEEDPDISDELPEMVLHWISGLGLMYGNSLKCYE